MADTEVSLRPLSLRPASNKNPFARFGKGAGHAIKNKEAPPADSYQPKKPSGERIRYSREYLLKFCEVFTKLPPQLENVKIDILLDEENPDRSAQNFALQRAADESDDRDWRARQPLPDIKQDKPVRAPDAPQQQPSQPVQSAVATNAEAAKPAAPSLEPAVSAKIVRAADVGRKAWMPGAQAGGNERALKQVKGILNKLTPEKFDRLLSQLLDVVTNLEILQGTISLVFESAVEQPTFVNLYADLCKKLSESLPQFPAEGDDKPVSFRRVLVNTCQEEYEGVAEAKEKLQGLTGDELEIESRKVKNRLLGTLRLVAELYQKEVVMEKIMHFCIQDLLGDAKGKPNDDNLEAVCEMLKIGGKSLEAGKQGSKLRVEGYFIHLKKLSNDKSYPSRIRFLLKDIIDLRTSKWIPRRETVQAKKIAEVHAQAQAELGMVPALNIASVAPDLPGLRARQNEEVELFPAFKSADDGWEVVGKKKTGAKDGKYSALLGDYVPVPVATRAPPEPATSSAPAAAPAQAPAAAPAQPAPAAAATSLRNLSPEEREARTKSLFDEFLSSNDMAEAILCARELIVDDFAPKMVELGISKLLDVTKEKEMTSLIDLLVSFAKRNAYAVDDLVAGMKVYTDQLEDLSMDVPFATKYLSELTAAAIREGLFGVDKLSELAEKIESAEPRRNYVAAVLKLVKGRNGEAKLKEMCTSSGFAVGELLKADPEFDPADLPDVETFLKQQGLAAVPV